MAVRADDSTLQGQETPHPEQLVQRWAWRYEAATHWADTSRSMLSDLELTAAALLQGGVPRNHIRARVERGLRMNGSGRKAASK